MKTVIGVMGGSVADDSVAATAQELGRRIAEEGWVLLTGGRSTGVMAAASQGAAEAGGLVVGVLPGDTTSGSSPHIDVAIPTGMGDARNVINVLSSHVVIALPGGAGTISEVALALKSERKVVTVGFAACEVLFGSYKDRGLITDVATPAEAVQLIRDLLGGTPV
ncbi:MAG: TIGR00725 family protein [Actinobacteria bacterium]|nr:MAG: TIGR00725 family protein [Actinomycetota bacterium]